MTCSIRRATGKDWAICRTLLPEACLASTTSTSGLLALRQSAPQVAGAAVVHFDDGDAWLHLKVVRPARRSGVGSELLEAAREIAAAEQAGRLLSVCDTEVDPAGEAFLLARGFAATGRCPSFEADVSSSLPVLYHARNWLLASGRVPPSITVTPLQPMHEKAVAQLYMEYIGGRPELAAAPLRLDHDLKRWELSSVLLIDGKVQGAAVLRVVDGVAHVPGLMVAREFQGTWVNALLLGAVGDTLARTQARLIHFSVPPLVKYTRKLARRLGARTLSVRTRFERAV